jgi:carotenoid cleavage dioxygenase-like enzyme
MNYAHCFFRFIPFRIKDAQSAISHTNAPFGGILNEKMCNKSSPFLIKNREIKKEIQYINNTDNDNDTNEIVKKISGFYGLIGPDIDKFSIKSLYDLFTGDGIIQGVFFDNGNITFVKHFVRTEKIVYEEQYGRFSKKILMTSLYILLNKMGMLPNVLGLANTALLNIDNHIFALFERDLPYHIDIHFSNKQVKTVKKININGLQHFSGHSKYDSTQKKIYTIDYDVITNTVSYITLNETFQQMDKVLVKTSYIPNGHDFTVLKNGFLFIDSPFSWDPFFFSPFRFDTINMQNARTSPLIFHPKGGRANKNWCKMPVTFAKTKPTFIHIYNAHTKMRTQYQSEESFYIFHYADVIENVDANANTIDIYGSLYDDLDFSSLHIQGKYRKITVDIHSGKVSIKKNEEFENMNLDFPIKWKEFVVLRSIENQKITGFVVCKELELVRKIMLPDNRYFCGEPSIVEIDGSPFLLGFSYDSFENGYIVMFELFTQKYIEIPLHNVQLNIGFHAMFLPDNKTV